MKMMPSKASSLALDTVRIWLLGGFRVSVGSRTIGEDRWQRRKAAALVKLLALAPSYRMHREQVMHSLWPRLGREAAANNLHRNLYVARRNIEPDPLTTSRCLTLRGEQLVLCPERDLWVDVEAFEQAAEAARSSGDPAAYRSAIDLYAGELLPEDRYEEWSEEHRRRLREMHLSLLLGLAHLRQEREDHDGAAEALREILAEDPIREEAHVGLMRLHALRGRQAEALRQYERLEEVLSRELGTQPGAASRTLREEIVARRFPPPERQLPVASESEGKRVDGDNTFKHNLPTQRTSFVGREREMLEIKRALAMTRLLTLTGAGGLGKTRLALEVARNLVGIYPDGVWLVELAPLTEGVLVPQAVAKAVKVPEQPGRPLTETLVGAMCEKRLLVVLDNCEHLIDATAQLAEVLLSSCPHLRILATSREALGDEGELVRLVDPLSVPEADPDAHQVPAKGELERYDAVRLFVERAGRYSPQFELRAENAGAVAQICRGLGGMPLAIELVAARMDVLAAGQIADRLDRALGLLRSGSRVADPRHQSLRATLKWSFEFLSQPERTLFGRLSVFSGGFSLEAAEAVGEGESIGRGGVLESLLMLVDKSLVVAEPAGEGGARYRLLEPVRQYALEKLEVSGEPEAVRRRHSEHFLALAEEAEQMFRGSEEARWLDRLEAEHDNLRAALSWTLGGGDPGLGLRLSTAIWRFWATRGYFGEGARWLHEALAKGGTSVPPAGRAGVLLGLGCILRRQSDYERAQAYLEESLGLYEELGDRGHVAESLEELAWVEVYRGNHERATPIFEESLAVARESGNRMVVPLVLLGLAQTALDRGDHKRRVRLLEEAVALFREQGNVEGACGAIGTMGAAELALGNYERATALLQEALALGREVGSKRYIAIDLSYLGIAATLRGDPNQAKALLKEALTMELELERKFAVRRNLEGLAEAAGALGEDVRAARLRGAAGALREAIGFPWRFVDRSLHEPQLVAVRSRMDAATWDTAFAEGRTMGLERAVEYALSEEPAASSVTPQSEQSLDTKASVVLTVREREVAAMVAQGTSNRQIAQDLYLSERTIEKHVSKILRKLDLASRAQVAAWATGQRRS